MVTLIIILCLIGMILQGLFVWIEHEKKYLPAVILKGSASVLFIIIGILAVNSKHTSGLVLAGLIFGGVGDILLNLKYLFPKAESKIFLTGVAAFLTGHIIYLCAIVKDYTPWFSCAIIGASIAIIVLDIIFKTLDLKIAYKIFGVLYLGAISFMVAMAYGNMITKPCTNTVFYAIGGTLFLISDIVLIFNSFGPKPKFGLRITNLTLYYLGQLFIATSLFFLI